MSLDTGEGDDLLAGGSGARYAPSGHLIYSAGPGTLQAIGFDAERLELTSVSPVPVLEDVSMFIGGAANFRVSASGSLLYASSADPGTSFVWVDRSGREEPLGLGTQPHQTFQLSPGGDRIAVEIDGNAGNSDIHVYDLLNRTRTQLTFSAARECCPLWSPDGERVVFSSSRDGPQNLYSRLSDGSGAVTRLTDSVRAQFAHTWADNGTTLVLEEDEDLYALPLDGESTPQPMLQTDYRETRASVSPDGRWIAYESNESGQDEVYVRRYRDFAGGLWVVSLGGPQDDEPLWSRDGREVFYRSPTNMMVVPVDTEQSFDYGTPETLFSFSAYPTGRNRRFDVSADGQRFLMAKSGTSDLVLVQNWTQELLERVPIN